MPRLLQFLNPFDAEAASRRADVPPSYDEDLALGCESADPSLQFEGWEPAPFAPQAGTPVA
jgi:hypothetical protein